MRRRILLIFMSFALILSFAGCNNGNEQVEETPKKTSLPVIDDGLPELDAEVLIRQVNPNINLVDSEYPYLEAWSDVISNRFGVDVKISFFPLYKVKKETPEEIYIYDYLRVSSQEGLLIHDLTDMDISYNVLKSLRESEGILPLTDYIKNSTYYEFFDKDLLNLLTDEQGDIWGIPIDKSHQIFEARSYKQSWLESTGMQVPNTVEEFYEVMKAFTYNDPDGNGENDTYGYYGPYNFKFALNDVLKAYGLYNGSTSFIAYNPNSETIEDSLLSPDASTALNFMNQFYSEGMVRKNGLSPGVYDSIIPNNCGSLLWSYITEEDIVYASSPLIGTNTSNLVYMTTYGKVYFMLLGTL